MGDGLELEERLAESMRYAARQVRPVPVERLLAPVRPARRRLFERRLRESLRHGADRVYPDNPLRHAPRRSRQPWYRGRLVVVAAGLLAAAMLCAPFALLHRHAAGVSRGGTHAVMNASELGYAGPHATIAANAMTDEPILIIRSLTTGLYHDYPGEQPVDGLQVSIDRGQWAYVIVLVAPAAPLAKTYLQRLVAAQQWKTLGPHELDANSRVSYLLNPTVTTTYRVFVPSGTNVSAAWSQPVTVRVRT